MLKAFFVVFNLLLLAKIQIGNFDDEDNEPTIVYSAQDAEAVKYFADLARLIMQKEGH